MTGFSSPWKRHTASVSFLKCVFQACRGAAAELGHTFSYLSARLMYSEWIRVPFDCVFSFLHISTHCCVSTSRVFLPNRFFAVKTTCWKVPSVFYFLFSPQWLFDAEPNLNQALMNNSNKKIKKRVPPLTLQCPALPLPRGYSVFSVKPWMSQKTVHGRKWAEHVFFFMSLCHQNIWFTVTILTHNFIPTAKLNAVPVETQQTRPQNENVFSGLSI